MPLFYITHTDEHGEAHQLGGAWEASYPDVAISIMLIQAGEKDDGKYEAHPVTSDADVI